MTSKRRNLKTRRRRPRSKGHKKRGRPRTRGRTRRRTRGRTRRRTRRRSRGHCRRASKSKSHKKRRAKKPKQCDHLPILIDGEYEGGQSVRQWGGAFNLRVNWEGHDSFFLQNMEEHTTIAEVKAIIERQTKIPADYQLLALGGGTELKDDSLTLGTRRLIALTDTRTGMDTLPPSYDQTVPPPPPSLADSSSAMKASGTVAKGKAVDVSADDDLHNFNEFGGGKRVYATKYNLNKGEHILKTDPVFKKSPIVVALCKWAGVKEADDGKLTRSFKHWELRHPVWHEHITGESLQKMLFGKKANEIRYAVFITRNKGPDNYNVLQSNLAIRKWSTHPNLNNAKAAKLPAKQSGTLDEIEGLSNTIKMMVKARHIKDLKDREQEIKASMANQGDGTVLMLFKIPGKEIKYIYISPKGFGGGEGKDGVIENTTRMYEHAVYLSNMFNQRRGDTEMNRKGAKITTPYALTKEWIDTEVPRGTPPTEIRKTVEEAGFLPVLKDLPRPEDDIWEGWFLDNAKESKLTKEQLKAYLEGKPTEGLEHLADEDIEHLLSQYWPSGSEGVKMPQFMDIMAVALRKAIN